MTTRTQIQVGVGFSTVYKGLKVLLKTSDVVPMIVGEQGIGKSQLVQGISRDLGAFYREITCSLVQEGDLAMPMVDKEANKYEHEGHMGRVKFALHTMLVDLLDNAKEHPEQLQILFLDEFNRASVAVQAELMNLVLQREIIGVQLPENVRLILASNPSSDMEGFEESEYHVNMADGAINDRTTRIRMVANLSDWVEGFAKKVINEEGRTQIVPIVREFLEDGNQQYFMDTTSDTDKKPTPRAWERVSNILYNFEDEGIEYGNNEYMPFINEAVYGSIGDKVGQQFLRYVRENKYFIRPSQILNADESEYKKLLEEFKDLNKYQEVRRNRIVETLAAFMALKKNQVDGILSKQNTNRLRDWVLELNEDSIQMMTLKIAEGEETDFVDYPALYEAILDNDDTGEYINKEYDITQRVSHLSSIMK